MTEYPRWKFPRQVCYVQSRENLDGSGRLYQQQARELDAIEEGAAFLEKPFTARGLREAARLILFGSN